MSESVSKKLGKVIQIDEEQIHQHLGNLVRGTVEDITEALWGTRVNPGTLSNLNKKIYTRIEKWRNRPITNSFPYLYLDGIVLKRTWAGEVRNVSVLVAIGLAADGYRQVLGVAEGTKADKAGWSGFMRHLKKRGLTDVKLIISDACLGLIESVGDFYPEAKWQRCIVHFYRNVFTVVPRGEVNDVARMLKAIHASEDKAAVQEKAEAVVKKLKGRKLHQAAEVVQDGIADTLTYYDFPDAHWRRIRTNNPLERILREVRRRTRVVGAFPDGNSALMLVAARLRHIGGKRWGTRCYLNMDLLKEIGKEEFVA
jgi:transposase-like protein